jgi:O-antigen biosynthesis protein
MIDFSDSGDFPLDKKQLATNEQLISQNSALVSQVSFLQHQLNEVLGSTSWKVTKPLRKVAEFKRLISPLVRFKKYYFAVNPSQQFKNAFELEARKKYKRLPSGVVAITTNYKSDKDQQAFFLYFGDSSGYSGDRRVCIFLDPKNRSPVYINLPEGTVSLRLDPFDEGTKFNISDVVIANRGKLQWLCWLLKSQFSSSVTAKSFINKLCKGVKLYKNGGFNAIKQKINSEDSSYDYIKWVKKYDTLAEADIRAIKIHIEQLPKRPSFSVIMPVYNPPLWALKAAVDSVKSQLYEDWELCIADDASTEKEIQDYLSSLAKSDKRIKLVLRKENGHISACSNSALELATGEYLAFLDHDDELTPHALYFMASQIVSTPDIKLIYSDEDKITNENLRHNPYFKPDWSPELLLSQNYICHFLVIKRDLVNQVGGFRLGLEGAQDWDLILRVSEHLSREEIRHIPEVLYHWRAIASSTAQSTSAKLYVLEAQRRAVSEHLERCGEKARVEINHLISQLRVHFILPKEQPEVSIIIPTKDCVDILEKCIDSIFTKTDYKNFKICIVDNNSSESRTKLFFNKIIRNKAVSVLSDTKEFNFSRLNNFAVSEINSPLLTFLNNDIEVINKEWLSEMVVQGIRPDIGAVGAKLYYPNGLIQHAGVILGINGIAGHALKGRLRTDVGYFNRLVIPNNVSAVTAACLLMRREVFNMIGGFNEIDFAVAFNDVDLCLRIGEKNLRIVYVPYAELFHHESISRGYENTPEKFARFENEIAQMKSRWRHLLKRDPYYNLNLTLLAENFSFAYPPRTEKPWKLRIHK